MPKGIPLTETELHARRVDIAQAAVLLFLQKGFQETSMREIAAAAGMGKSSLYDYFETKDDILLFILEGETTALFKQAESIACQDSPPEERLRQIMEMDLRHMQANRSLLLRLGAEAQRLKAGSQRRIQEQRYAYQDTVRAIIEEGIHSGAFREVNPLLAARVLINSILSILFTTRHTGSEKEMLDEVLEIYLSGLKP